MSYNKAIQVVSKRLLDSYWTTLVAVPTSCLVASDTFNFLTARLRATLRGLLSESDKSTSRLDGYSTTGTCGIPTRLNLERSWKRCYSVSSSLSLDVSSMTTTLKDRYGEPERGE
jgi:hypothetical protein